MPTPSDILSLLIFGVLAIVFLHRSAQASGPDRPLWSYGVAALACAAGDVAANAGRPLLGGGLLLAAVLLLGWILTTAARREPNS